MFSSVPPAQMSFAAVRTNGSTLVTPGARLAPRRLAGTVRMGPPGSAAALGSGRVWLRTANAPRPGPQQPRSSLSTGRGEEYGGIAPVSHCCRRERSPGLAPGPASAPRSWGCGGCRQPRREAATQGTRLGRHPPRRPGRRRGMRRSRPAAAGGFSVCNHARSAAPVTAALLPRSRPALPGPCQRQGRRCPRPPSPPVTCSRLRLAGGKHPPHARPVLSLPPPRRAPRRSRRPGPRAARRGGTGTATSGRQRS